MPPSDRSRLLAGAASYLCLAERQLRLAGCAGWPEQLSDLLQAIDLELALLEGTDPQNRPWEFTR